MHELTLHDLPDATGKSVGYTFAFAGSWEECPAEHFPQAVLARAAPKDHGGVRFQLLRLLAGIPAHLAHRLPPADHFTKLVKLPAEFGEFGQPMRKARQELRLLPELDWLYGPALLFTSKLPGLTHAGTTWTGPDDNLSHMSLDQWRWGVKLLKHFREEKDDAKREVHLNNLVGALYSPVARSDEGATKRSVIKSGPSTTHARAQLQAATDRDGPRSSAQEWSSLPIEDHAALLKDLPLETKIAAAFNFEALNAVLPQQYKRTFGGESNGPTSPQGILDISYDVAESGALGDYDAVNARLLHTVLAYMENNLYKDERAMNERPAAPSDGVTSFSQRV